MDILEQNKMMIKTDPSTNRAKMKLLYQLEFHREKMEAELSDSLKYSAELVAGIAASRAREGFFAVVRDAQISLIPEKHNELI